MFRSCFLPVALSAFVGASSVQAQFFIEAGGAYFGRIGGSTFDSYNPDNGKVKRYAYNPAQGIGGGLNIGYGFNDRVGAEVRLAYVMGRKLVITDEYDVFGGDFESERTYTSSYVRIEPALRLSSGEGAVRIYAAVGPSFALGMDINSEELATTNYPGATFPTETRRREQTEEIKLTGGCGVGAFGAIGFMYQGSGMLGFFAEFSGNAMSWAPKKGAFDLDETVTLVNGSSSSDSESSDIEFVNEYDDDDDDKALKEYFHVSTWAVRLGVHLRFGGAE